MNEPIAKLYVTQNNQVLGEMLNPPEIHASGAPPVKDYGDLWGFKNYGMGRLLTKDQVKFLTESGPLFHAGWSPVSGDQTPPLPLLC